MKKKTEVELQRQRISLILRAQASIVRAEFLNSVLPDALGEFDARVQAGEAFQVQAVDVNKLIEEAATHVIG